MWAKFILRIHGRWAIGRLFGLILGGLLCGGVWLIGMPALQSAEPSAESLTALPPNFQIRTVASGLQLPTDMVLLPSGDIFVTEKGTGLGDDGTAHVRLVRQGQLVDEPVLSLSVTVLGDSGIYSIVLDPAFVANHFFYLWYSIGEQAVEWPGRSVDRLSRFTYDPQTRKADAASEVIILDGIQWSQWHNGGGVAFDEDGNLLVATGDAATNSLGQNMASLNGKLLRIRPNAAGGYSVPTDNVFLAQAEIRPEIHAAGLRNPFRMTWRPAEQAFYLIDLGFGAWEEINRVTAGANYGWAVREGPCPYNVRDVDCPPAPPTYTDPVVAYPHPPEGGAGITALAFYSGTVWPEQYQGLLFFADFNSRSISMVSLDDPKNILPFGSEVGHLVDFEATAEGIYVLSIYEGVIRFIYYSEAGNQWPTAQLVASPLQGAAPLTVQFSGAGSTDPENDPLTYLWDFGDGGAPVTSTVATTSHRYASDGDYQASLQVIDQHSGKSEVQRTTIQVYSGAMPTIKQEIVGDGQRNRYRGGDEVRFSVVRTGGKTGLDATTPYIWSIKQHHNEHVHFVTAEYPGDGVILQISDDSHAAEVSIWYETELIMVTDQGQKVRVTRILHPDVVGLDVSSVPSRASMLWNGARQISDQPIAAIVGQRFTLEAPLIHYNGRTKNRFVRWEITTEGNDEREIISERSFELQVGVVKKSYAAHYELIAPAQVNYLPSIQD